MRRTISCVSIFLFTVALACLAQTDAKPTNLSTTVCTFEDTKEFSIRYARLPLKEGEKAPSGKPWTPGKSPIYLFTQAPLKIGNIKVPIGAFSLFLMSGKTEWTLVVNSEVKSEQPYDEKQDLGRATMQIGTLSSPADQFTMYLGHVAPKKCTLRVDYASTRAFVDIEEQ